MAAMPATSSASPCQAPSPAGLGLPLLTSPGARTGTLAFGRRGLRLRLRGAAAAVPAGEDSTAPLFRFLNSMLE
jgi:hypothetical protein